MFRVDDVSLVAELEGPELEAATPGAAEPEPAWSSPEEAGLAAEMAGDWQGALAIYLPLLAEQPERADLWIRVAEIEAALQPGSVSQYPVRVVLRQNSVPVTIFWAG